MNNIQIYIRPEQIIHSDNGIIIKLSGEEYLECITESRKSKKSIKLSTAINKFALEAENKGQPRTAQSYRSTFKAFQTFLEKKDISLVEITFSRMLRFQDYLTAQGKSLNTVSYYIRNLRAVYNKALLSKMLPPPVENPFRGLYTGNYPTKKRALKKEELQSLFQLELSGDNPGECNLPEQRHLGAALKYFLFCFLARGMSFVDLAFLQKSDIRGKEIVYRRRKTRKLLTLSICSKMQRIIDYFAPFVKDSPYVFPIILPGSEDDEYHQYKKALNRQLHRLKKIGIAAGLPYPLTTHVARHSWATLAKRENIPTSVISEALGHRDEKTTAIYLDSFEKSVIYQAGEIVSNLAMGQSQQPVIPCCPLIVD